MNVERVLAASANFETPLAVVDEDVMEANLARMAAVAKSAGVALRPHGKTHKSAFVAQRQMEHGAIGLTAATLREAEVFADAGCRDLLVAHPPVGAAKLRRLGKLAERVHRLAVSLDDAELARSLPSGVEFLWEVDSGHHRLGRPPGEDTANAVAELVRDIGDDQFRGLLTFPGHVYAAANQSDLERVAVQEWSALTESADLLAKRGIEVRELSVGSTPTAIQAPSLRGATEIRPGSYVYGDAQQVALGSQSLDDCALGVVATVVSTPSPGRAVLDAGSKGLSCDNAVAALQTFGLIAGRDDLRLVRLSEEHGILVADRATQLQIGDRLVVIPTHCCTTINLHPTALFVGKGGAHIDPVAARGWSSSEPHV